MGAGQDATSSQAVYQFLRTGVPTGPWPTPPARPIQDGPAFSFNAEGHPGYVEPAAHAAGSSSSGAPRPGAAPAEQWQAPGPAAPALPPLPPGPAPRKATKATFVPPTFKAPPPLAPGAAAVVAALCAASDEGAAPCVAATGAAPCAAAMGAAPGAAGGGGLAPSGAAACADGGAAAGTLPAAVGAAPAPPAATMDCTHATLSIISPHWPNIFLTLSAGVHPARTPRRGQTAAPTAAPTAAAAAPPRRASPASSKSLDPTRARSARRGAPTRGRASRARSPRPGPPRRRRSEAAGLAGIARSADYTQWARARKLAGRGASRRPVAALARTRA